MRSPNPMSDELVLYHEVQGSGPIVLLVPPTPGDGGQFTALASALQGFTVITYDRRGAGRSAAPDGWTATTVAEQADDAAAVLRRVTTERALVYGTSNGAMVALELAVRHPELVATLVLHEMPLLSVVADPAPVGRMLGEVIGEGMARGGPVAALDGFLRFAYGDALVDGLDPALRARMAAAAETVFSVEMPAFQSYRPDDDALRAAAARTRLLVGEEQRLAMFAEVATWLAGRLPAEVVVSPGGHAPHLSHPEELAALIAEAGGSQG